MTLSSSVGLRLSGLRFRGREGGHDPMGPLRSTDLGGLDVRLAIAEHLEPELGERFAPPARLRDKVARGELGRNSGRGFYQWEGTR